MSRLIIDVREPAEYKLGHAQGAINIPPSELMSGTPGQLVNIPHDTEIILYCISGARSNSAMHLLRGYGFTNLINGINKEQVGAKYV